MSPVRLRCAGAPEAAASLAHPCGGWFRSLAVAMIPDTLRRLEEAVESLRELLVRGCVVCVVMSLLSHASFLVVSLVLLLCVFCRRLR